MFSLVGFYTKKQLDRIADYYQIPKRKKKKAELVEEIVIFENVSILGKRLISKRLNI